jgi:hypothetical protein
MLNNYPMGALYNVLISNKRGSARLTSGFERVDRNR